MEPAADPSQPQPAQQPHSTPPWHRHNKHVLVMTQSGKPVFTRHGDDDDAAAITSIVQAVVTRAADSGDPLRSLTLADGTRFVFSNFGPLTLLAISRTHSSETELRSALAALHGFLALTLTGSVLNRVAEKHGSGGDLRPHLAGTRNACLNVLRAANRLPGGWLQATPILSIGPATRARLTSLLSGAAECPGVVYAAVVAGYALVSWAQPKDKALALAPSDAQLLTAFVQSGESFRRSESSWSPLCLPALNASGYLQAWISMLSEVPPDGASLAGRITAAPAPASKPGGGAGPYHIDRSYPGVFLVLISQASDAGSAMALATATASIAGQLRESGVLDAVNRTLALAGPVGCGDFPPERYAAQQAGCVHLLYCWRPWGQYTQSTLPGVVASHGQRKALLSAYAHAYERLMTSAGPGQPTMRHYVASFPGLQPQADAARDGSSQPPAGVVTIAGIHTTNALLFAAFDASVAHADVPGAMERLAKALRSDNDKLLLAAPGVL